MQDEGRKAGVADQAQQNTFSVESQAAKWNATAPDNQAPVEGLPGKEDMRAGEAAGLRATTRRDGQEQSPQQQAQTRGQGQVQQAPARQGLVGMVVGMVAEKMGLIQRDEPQHQQEQQMQSPARQQTGFVSRPAPEQARGNGNMQNIEALMASQGGKGMSRQERNQAVVGAAVEAGQLYVQARSGGMAQSAAQAAPQQSVKGMDKAALGEAVGAMRNAVGAGMQHKGAARQAPQAAQETPGQEQFQAAKKEREAAAAPVR